MGHEQHRCTRRLPELLQLGAKTAGGDGVEVAERFVHQKKIRLDRQCACDADALAHAAGQLAGIHARGVGEVDHLQELHALAAGEPCGHRSSWTYIMLSMTVRQGSSRGSWKTYPIRAAAVGLAGYRHGARRRLLHARTPD